MWLTVLFAYCLLERPWYLLCFLLLFYIYANYFLGEINFDWSNYFVFIINFFAQNCHCNVLLSKVYFVFLTPISETITEIFCQSNYILPNTMWTIYWQLLYRNQLCSQKCWGHSRHSSHAKMYDAFNIFKCILLLYFNYYL